MTQRTDAKAFWEMVQEKNAGGSALGKKAADVRSKNGSCGNCKHYKGYRCLLKKKLIEPYRYCEKWERKEC